MAELEVGYAFIQSAGMVISSEQGGRGLAGHEVSVLIGGRAGDGISSAGQIVAHLLGQAGYRVHMYFDYPSLIKGGHNFAIVRAAEEKIGAVREGVDFILALNQETVNRHRSRLSEGGVIIHDTTTVKSSDGIGIPVAEILKAEERPGGHGELGVPRGLCPGSGNRLEICRNGDKKIHAEGNGAEPPGRPAGIRYRVRTKKDSRDRKSPACRS